MTQFLEGPTPPLIRGEGVPTMMNPNYVMVVVLKDILCLLGFSHIHSLY